METPLSAKDISFSSNTTKENLIELIAVELKDRVSQQVVSF